MSPKNSTTSKLFGLMTKAKTAEDCRRIQNELDQFLLDGYFDERKHKALTDSNALRLRAIRAQDTELEELRTMRDEVVASQRRAKGRVVADRLGSAAKRTSTPEGVSPEGTRPEKASN